MNGIVNYPTAIERSTHGFDPFPKIIFCFSNSAAVSPSNSSYRSHLIAAY